MASETEIILDSLYDFITDVDNIRCNISVDEIKIQDLTLDQLKIIVFSLNRNIEKMPDHFKNKNKKDVEDIRIIIKMITYVINKKQHM